MIKDIEHIQVEVENEECISITQIEPENKYKKMKKVYKKEKAQLLRDKWTATVHPSNTLKI